MKRYVFRRKRNVALASAVDFLGNAFFSVFRRKIRTGTPKSVLIVRLDHIGDVLLSTGLPKLLKKSLPGTRVYFLAASWAAPLLRHNPFIDELIVYDPPWFARGKKRAPGTPGFLRLAVLLKSRNIEAALAPRGDARENALLWMSGIRRRVGYGVTGGGFFLTDERPYEEGAHQLRHPLNLLPAFGIKNADAPPRIYFSDEEERGAEALFGRLGLDPEKRYIGVQLRAGTSAKEWSAERWAEFFGFLRERVPSHEPVLVGLKADARDEALLSGGVVAAGKTSLRELSVLMRRFDAFVGPDSGPSHLAAALHVPTLFLYSGTNVYEEWAPPSDAARVLRKITPCTPCGLTVCAVDGHPCMSEITAEDAIRHLKELLCRL